jgi:hypothetical protein
MSNYNQLLNSGIQAVDNYYSDITTGANNVNSELLTVNNKNSVLFEKQKISYAITDDTDLLSNYLTKLDTYKVKELR